MNLVFDILEINFACSHWKPFWGVLWLILYNNMKDSTDFYSLFLPKICHQQHILVFYYVLITDLAVDWHGREHV